MSTSSTSSSPESDEARERRQWRLLPSEQILWRGAREDVPLARALGLLPVLVFALGTIALLFAGLLKAAEMPGVRNSIATSSLLFAFGVAAILLPRYFFDDCRYLVTDRRVLFRRKRLVRAMARQTISFARIRWHHRVPGIGHLELVVAVPFGPLARTQRVTLYDIAEPERVLALIRDQSPNQHVGDLDVALSERLDVGERLLWGGHPQGLFLDWRHLGTALFGGLTFTTGLAYGYRTGLILLDLEELGLQVRSQIWALLFSAVAISTIVILAVGATLIWYGFLRSRALAHETEYVLTNRRLLIRRGRVQLSVDRAKIVDVATRKGRRGLKHLFLVLDAPYSRALGDSGALSAGLPSRDAVPPVLFDLEDGTVSELILARLSEPS